MLQQDDVALADVVISLSEQLQQVQLQLAEQQAITAEQARQIDALIKNDVKQDRQVDRLTDNVARLEAEQKVIAALQDNGTGYSGCCMSALTACKHFSSVLIPAKCI